MKTEKALATTQETALAEVPQAVYELDATEYVEGTDKLDREDLQIPHLVLVQPTHADIPDGSKHVGEWYNDLTGEFSESVNAVLLAETKGRAAFPRAFGRDSEPLCASDDALMPRPQHIGVTITDEKTGLEWTIDDAGCSACPLSKFSEDGTPPLCSKAYNYAMVDENGIPFVMRAQRTGTSAAKQLNTVAKLLGRRKMIAISSREVVSNTGKYFVPVFSTDGFTPKALKDHAMRLSLTLGNIASRAETPSNGNGHAEPMADEMAEEETPF